MNKRTKEEREETQIYIGNRLAALRQSKNLTQAEFIQDFSDFCHKKEKYTVQTISSWEKNRRLPTTTTIIALARYYNVSVDYLYNLTDKPNNSSMSKKQQSIDELIKSTEIPISNKDYVKYDGLPVYVQSINGNFSNWGIMDYNYGRIVCKDITVSISSDIAIYAYAVQTVRPRIMSYQHLLETPYVWIEMKTGDADIKQAYNGRYRHNENKTFLVKIDNNLTLKYEGLDISYWAFRA